MTTAAALALIVAAAFQPQAFNHREESELLEFSYGWPAVVGEQPALVTRLAAEMTEERARALEWAEEDRASRGDDFPFNQHHYAKQWDTAGVMDRLLSLTAATESYSGGAHGNLSLHAVLWDRAEDRELDPVELLGEAATARLSERYCAALDAERAERRGEPISRDDFFGDCPALAEQALAPVDEDGDDRFERLDVLIPPYAAGPWVEGPYVIAVSFEAGDFADLPPEYRDAFETGDCSAAMGGQRHRLVAVAAAPDAVGEAVILAGTDPARENLAGGRGGEFLDGGAAGGGPLGVEGAALDVDRVHARPDPGGSGADQAHIAVGLLADEAGGAKLARFVGLESVGHCAGRGEAERGTADQGGRQHFRRSLH